LHETEARHQKNQGQRITAMPLILKNKTDRIAFRFGARSVLRSTNELVDQLQEQLWRERAQHAFNLAENERELKAALRELAEVRCELARRDRSEAFARAPSPSTSLH
jgi:ribosomal protein L29